MDSPQPLVNKKREKLQTIKSVLFRSPKPSGKHRPAPPPPVSRALVIQIEPTNIGETSTETEKDTFERERRSSGSLSGLFDRLPYRRQRSSTYTKEQENSSSKEDIHLLSVSPTSNDGVYTLKTSSDSNDIKIPDKQPNTPGEITQF